VVINRKSVVYCERLLVIPVQYNMMLQVLRNFDGMISGAVTQQLVESGVKVMSSTQVRAFVSASLTLYYATSLGV